MTTNSRKPDPYLLDIQADTGSAVETLRLSTHTISTRGTDTPANVVYDGRISDPGKFSQVLFDQAGAVSGRAAISAGYIEMINADGMLDPWLNYAFGRSFVLKSLPTRDTPISSATTVMRGIVDGIESSDPLRRLRLRIGDRLALLDKPLLTVRYAGTTTSAGATAEGDAELKGQIKPYAWGINPEVPGKLVNRHNNLWQFAANAQVSMVVKEGGLALTSIGNVGSLAALIALTVLPGQYATCLALGIAMLGHVPVRGVTADLVEGASAALRSAARVTGRIFDQAAIASADRDSASFDVVHSFNAAEVSCYVDDEAKIIDACSEVLSSIGAVLNATPAGLFQLVGVGAPSSTVVGTLTRRDLLGSNASLQIFAGPGSEGDGVPAWSVLLDWGRIWRAQSESELYANVSAAQRTYLAQEFRRVQASDAAVKTRFPLAAEIVYQTLLAASAAATTEAARRLALHKVRRDRLSFPVPMTRAEGWALGASVKVQMNRLGYDAGRNFLIIGREEDWKRKVTTLRLWG